MGIFCCPSKDDFYTTYVNELEEVKNLKELANWLSRLIEHIESDSLLLNEREVTINF